MQNIQTLKTISDFESNLPALDKHSLIIFERGVPFLGFHYTASFGNLSELDERSVEQQFRHLIENEEWLSDEELNKLKSVRKI